MKDYLNTEEIKAKKLANKTKERKSNKYKKAPIDYFLQYKSISDKRNDDFVDDLYE